MVDKNTLENLLQQREALDREIEEAQRILREENEKHDFELPIYGYVAYCAHLGTKYTASSEQDAKAWLGLTPGEVFPVVKLSDAKAIIRELMDMVTSLSETQATQSSLEEPKTIPQAEIIRESISSVTDCKNAQTQLELVQRSIEQLPTLVLERPIPHRYSMGDPKVEASNVVITRLNSENMVGVPMEHYLSMFPQELNNVTKEALGGFSISLGLKLKAAQDKYGYSAGWSRKDWMDECRMHLRQHLEKGDPRDVAAYAMFLWYHGETTKLG